ncbi:hypothetical protein [Fluviispira multicolorata]|uniref:ComF family protein n=1 Tax=Fluviispira multicolorata TaxID=2654512 RepID=A0A833JB91_9BACT|nr:hypothetical protein [Fluviispira multicolorata]KAB8027760.1 hypothetical protein GCL57_14230 [Fluviispira multicolorata]
MIYNFSRCYLCKKKVKNSIKILCESCFSIAQKRECLFCMRCGKMNCLGCEDLFEFSRVMSFYKYCPEFSKILVLAKDNNDCNAQKLFYELFYNPIKNFLQNYIFENKIEYVVLSPLRKERILNSGWHTNIFFQHILESITENLKNKNFLIYIYYPHILGSSKKNAIKSKLERRYNYSNLIEQKISWHCANGNKKLIWDNNKNLLLLDDVLTTGRTARQLINSIQQVNNNNLWSLFTIFRSPQKEDENLLKNNS